MNEYIYTSTLTYVDQLALEIKSDINRTVAVYEDTDVPVGHISIHGQAIMTSSAENEPIRFIGDGGADNLKITLDDPLSSAEKSTLDNTILNHTPNPNYIIPSGSL